jgi:hypothetical protein
VREVVEVVLAVMTVLVIAILLILGLGYVYTNWQCAAYERATGKSTKVEAATCYVRQDGVWMHWSEYKFRFATQGAK